MISKYSMMIYIWNFSESLKNIIKKIFDEKTEIFIVDTSKRTKIISPLLLVLAGGGGGGAQLKFDIMVCKAAIVK